MDFAFTCGLCGCGESWDSDFACKAAAIWHLYDMHRENWNEQTSTTILPGVPKPEQFGSRYEEWESQL